MNMITSSCLCFAIVVTSTMAAEQSVNPEVGSEVSTNNPALMIERYGYGPETVVSNGYIFIDFEFVQAPYRLQRIGQAVVVNGMLVNNLFLGDPEKTVEENRDWRSPMHGFKAETPKTMADLQINILMKDLEGNGVVFVNSSAHSNSRPMTVNRTATWKEKDMLRLWSIVSSDDPQDSKHASIKNLHLKGMRTDDEVDAFWAKALTSTHLQERIKLRRAATEGKQNAEEQP